MFRVTELHTTTFRLMFWVEKVKKLLPVLILMSKNQQSLLKIKMENALQRFSCISF